MGKRKQRQAEDLAQAPGKQQKLANGAAAAAPPAPQPTAAAAAAGGGGPSFKNKEKVLVLGTRGITFRFRHLMQDLQLLLPHSKKDVKLDTKNDRGVINEVADMKGCSAVLFFEARKREDLYLWMSKCPAGPAAKFLVQNVHTMDELKLTGNHLKGSRPVLSFDPHFDQEPHLQLLKEMLTHVFATPRRHHKSKPFFDHVFSFTVADGRIWFRNYQVVLPLDKKKPDPSAATLVEVGPRFALQPIKIFSGSFGGPVLYDNAAYTPPNLIRRMIKQQKAGKYVAKVKARSKRREHLGEHQLSEDEVDAVFRG